jgi:hypothetical protein
LGEESQQPIFPQLMNPTIADLQAFLAACDWIGQRCDGDPVEMAAGCRRHGG